VKKLRVSGSGYFGHRPFLGSDIYTFGQGRVHRAPSVGWFEDPRPEKRTGFYECHATPRVRGVSRSHCQQLPTEISVTSAKLALCRADFNAGFKFLLGTLVSRQIVYIHNRLSYPQGHSPPVPVLPFWSLGRYALPRVCHVDLAYAFRVLHITSETTTPRRWSRGCPRYIYFHRRGRWTIRRVFLILIHLLCP